MTLDKLLKQSAAWLEQARKRKMFDKVDENSIKFPEEQRQRRMAELKVRIDALSRRKEDAAASYDRAIALDKAELDRLAEERPPTAVPKLKPRPAKARAKRK